jgi:hypothetical protein
MGSSFAAQLIDALETSWPAIARPNQLPPPGDWQVWLLLAGRGFGKTRTLAEWVCSQVVSGQATRVALVAATAADARDVLVEGESGILAVAPPRCRPIYEPSKRRLSWPNGAFATTFSAEEPERLRGPQHDAAVCDELGSWARPETWDMLMFGLRLGRKKVPRGGCCRLADRVLAHVRTSGGPTGPAQPVFRRPRSSPPLSFCSSLTRSNRRGTDPYARWCGRGGAARRPPIPICVA